jgi:hypothetical protein
MIGTLSAVPSAAVSSPNGTATCAAEMWLDEMAELYLLAFMLTADKVMAEQCVLDAMDEYLNSNDLSLIDWVKNKGRHAVIERAVQRATPKVKAVYTWSVPGGTRASISSSHQPFAVITALSAFERFVYVLTVLEGYQVDECADVLQCLPAEVVAASRLSHQLVGLNDAEESMSGGLKPLLLASAVVHSRCGIS